MNYRIIGEFEKSGNVNYYIQVKVLSCFWTYLRYADGLFVGSRKWYGTLPEAEQRVRWEMECRNNILQSKIIKTEIVKTF